MQKKNKAKGKPVRNPPSVQKTTASSSVAIPQPPPPVVEGTQIKISEDNRVPEIQTTPIYNVPEKELPKNSQESGPVKPKRHRGGKKRKQNESKDTSEVEITEISSEPLEAAIIIANVDVIETQPTQSIGFTEKPPDDEKKMETIKNEGQDGVKDLNENKQPIAPRKKKGKQQKKEQPESDLVKPASDIHSKKEEKHDETTSVKEELQINVDEMIKSDVEKITPQKKEDDVKINSQAQKCEPRSEECQKHEEHQSKEQATEKNHQKINNNEKGEAKDAMKKTDSSHACEIRKSDSLRMEIQKSEPIMDVPKKSEIEQQKSESHKNKKQKTEPQKENECKKSEPESTEPLKEENHQYDQSKADKSKILELVTMKEKPPECDAAQAMLPGNMSKPESIKEEEHSAKQDSTGVTCVTEVESKYDEKCGKNKKKQKNKDSRIKAENPENVIVGSKEAFKFAPDISVVTELPIIEPGNLHKESLPKISEEQNKVTILEITEKETKKIAGHPSPDIIDVEKEPGKFTDITSPTEHPTKEESKEKIAIKEQEDRTADIGDKAQDSSVEKKSMEMLLPNIAKAQDIDFSHKQILKSPETHQSDIARDLKCIEDEMKIIMDLTPALSNIPLHLPALHPTEESETLNKEIEIDLICEVPANIVGETSSINVNKEATSLPSDTTEDSSLEMEMWKEVIEKSLREFTELESKNESIGTISQQPFSPPADMTSVNTQLAELPIQKIETEMSNLTIKNVDTSEKSVKERVESPTPVIIEKNKEPGESFKTETKLPETTPILNIDPELEVKSEAIIIDPSIESQNTPQQDQLARSNEQRHKGKGKSKKVDKKNKQDSSPTMAAASQSSTAVISTEGKESEKSKSESEDKKIEESKPVEEKGKTSGETKECEASGQTCFVTEIQDSARSTEIINVKKAGNDLPSDTNHFLLPTSSSGCNVQQQEDTMSKSFTVPKSNEDLICHETEPVDPKEIFKPDKENDDVENPTCTRPKNLLGHPNIPVTSNKNDYKKEKNKNVEKINPQEAKIKIKDVSKTDLPETSQKTARQDIESKNEKGITESDNINHSIADSDNEEDEYVYKYSFRKVFLANTCNICKVDLLNNRMSCGYCNLVGYCGQRHKDDDWTQHQALCFAVSTIVHLRGLKFVYADAKSITGQEYRLLRMQTIVSCEKILKRKLTPWEQEILLYPRMCFDSECREFRQALLEDCKDCLQVSFCKEYPAHLSLDHKQWCKSYKLYQKLVLHQLEKGRIEPKLPSKIITNMEYQMPADMTAMLKQLYGNEFGETMYCIKWYRRNFTDGVEDCDFAALTQIATAPLTALYGYQLYIKALSELSKEGKTMMNGIHQHSKFTIHIVGAELQFEADTLRKWEVFFLHLYPGVNNLTVTFIGPELNPSNLPLDLLNRIRMCNACKEAKRKVDFEFNDRILYHDFVKTNEFCKPDLICAFNPGLHRTTGFSGLDSWPDTIRSIIALKNTPICITSYTKHELPKDLKRVRECVEADDVKVYFEPTLNPYSSTRPDRNFISDDEMPLIFKNYYLMVVSG